MKTVHYCAYGAWNSHHWKKFRFLGIVLLTMSHKSDNQMIGLFPKVLCSITKKNDASFSHHFKSMDISICTQFPRQLHFPVSNLPLIKKLKQPRQSLRVKVWVKAFVAWHAAVMSPFFSYIKNNFLKFISPTRQPSLFGFSMEPDWWNLPWAVESKQFLVRFR